MPMMPMMRMAPMRIAVKAPTMSNSLSRLSNLAPKANMTSGNTVGGSSEKGVKYLNDMKARKAAEFEEQCKTYNDYTDIREKEQREESKEMLNYLRDMYEACLIKQMKSIESGSPKQLDCYQIMDIINELEGGAPAAAGNAAMRNLKPLLDKLG